MGQCDIFAFKVQRPPLKFLSSFIVVSLISDSSSDDKLKCCKALCFRELVGGSREEKGICLPGRVGSLSECTPKLHWIPWLVSHCPEHSRMVTTLPQNRLGNVVFFLGPQMPWFSRVVLTRKKERELSGRQWALPMYSQVVFTPFFTGILSPKRLASPESY